MIRTLGRRPGGAPMVPELEVHERSARAALRPRRTKSSRTAFAGFSHAAPCGSVPGGLTYAGLALLTPSTTSAQAADWTREQQRHEPVCDTALPGLVSVAAAEGAGCRLPFPPSGT